MNIRLLKKWRKKAKEIYGVECLRGKHYKFAVWEYSKPNKQPLTYFQTQEEAIKYCIDLRNAYIKEQVFMLQKKKFPHFPHSKRIF